MKIGILTQPLFTNYGGLLQAYALQTVLEDMGHNVEVIRRDPPQLSLRFPNSFILEIKYYLRKFLRGKSNIRSARQNMLLMRETAKFVKAYIHTTGSLYSNKQLKKFISRHPYNAYVVGSDQVWRPEMSPNIFNYFIDFDNRDDVKRVAYAASFGVDTWEFSEEETMICSVLAKRFEAISVRESSGVDLCKEYLGVNATHVLDPTFLLEKEEYIQLVQAAKEPQSTGNLFCYVLDKSAGKTAVIRNITEKQGSQDYYCMPELQDTPENIERNPKDCIFPPVTKWLRSFMDAEMVVTDSFHGTAFSIIFNKPFWVIGNKERGLSRFESLLGLFGLSDRLVTPAQAENIDWNEPIDWDAVNRRKKELQVLSKDFLKNI